MKWPWVSRLAYDTLLAQLEHCRAENQQLIDHLGRVQRVERGLPERPRQPRPKVERMPDDVRQEIRGYASPAVRAELTRESIRRHHLGGVSWDTILQELKEPVHGTP